jgi:hypothetical protein
VRQVGLCESGDPGFRGSEEVNLDHGWTLVEGRKKRQKKEKNLPSFLKVKNYINKRKTYPSFLKVIFTSIR